MIVIFYTIFGVQTYPQSSYNLVDFSQGYIKKLVLFFKLLYFNL